MRKLVSSRDMCGFEILNFRFQNLASAPTPYGKGHPYFDTVQNKLGIYNGSGWDYMGVGSGTVTLTGEVTGSGTGSFATTITNSAVIGKVLTGLSTATGGNVVATDTILAAIGRLENRTALNDAKISYNTSTVISQLLTGFSASAGTVAATDSILTGFNKMQGTITNLSAASHGQNTDLGTSSNTFYIGSSGPKIKNASNVVEIRNNADNAYADLKCGNLTVTGTFTQTTSQIVNIGDSQIVLNADIATNAANSNGGISVKRLMADNTTRKDAELNYNVSSNYWEMVFGDVASTLRTKRIAAYYEQPVGDGTNVNFTITHNLNNKFAQLRLKITSTGEEVDCDVTASTVDTISITAYSPTGGIPTSNYYTASVIG